MTRSRRWPRPPLAVRQFWATLTRPRRGLLPYLLRRRSLRRRLAGPALPLWCEHDYDRAIRDYLTMWLDPAWGFERRVLALAHFGIDSEEASFVEQMLCSAAYGTLGCWVGVEESPWFRAACRLAGSLDRAALQRLRWELEP